MQNALNLQCVVPEGGGDEKGLGEIIRHVDNGAADWQIAAARNLLLGLRQNVAAHAQNTFHVRFIWSFLLIDSIQRNLKIVRGD